MSKQYKMIHCRINGKDRDVMVDVRASLTDMLRTDFRLTSVKKGCEVGECGACNVLINGECFNSCIYLAVWADGKDILTLEGLEGPNNEISDIQQAFIDAGGTLSHHHGVGTDHAPWMEQDLYPAGVDLMVGLLKAADPKRNLNPGTLIPKHREW